MIEEGRTIDWGGYPNDRLNEDDKNVSGIPPDWTGKKIRKIFSKEKWKPCRTVRRNEGINEQKLNQLKRKEND